MWEIDTVQHDADVDHRLRKLCDEEGVANKNINGSWCGCSRTMTDGSQENTLDAARHEYLCEICGAAP